MKKVSTILVVDDESMMRELLVQTLDSQGFQTLSAANGQLAFNLVSSQPGIDLILTDLNMPEWSGLRLIESLRESPYKNIPVILMTGDGEQAGVAHIGVTLLRKPFRRRELMETLKTILPQPSK